MTAGRRMKVVMLVWLRSPGFDMSRVQPFSCGSQYIDWQCQNCDYCQKFDNDNPENNSCEIDEALLDAQGGDGTISSEIAKRMGHMKDADSWACPEIQRTSEVACHFCGRVIKQTGFDTDGFVHKDKTTGELICVHNSCWEKKGHASEN